MVFASRIGRPIVVALLARRMKGTFAVQFALSEEQSLLKDTVDRFVKARYAAGRRAAYRTEAGGYGADNWRGLSELGILGLMFPAAYGGLAGGPRDLTAVMEALGGGGVVEPVLEEVVIAGGVIALAGSEAQKARWLPAIAAGSAHLALAHFEHTARFDLEDVRTSAEAAGDGWRLTGSKSVVPLAGGSDRWVVSARVGGTATDSSGMGFFLVNPGAAGIERQDFRLTDGSWASALHFRGTPANERLPGGFAEFARAVDLARLAAGAEMVGIMATLFESTLDYLRSRRQFGAPLASFQALQHRLADFYVLLEQSRSHVCRAASCIEGGRDSGRSVAGMKSYVSRAAVTVAEGCVHLHGGIGMTNELALGHGFKRILVLSNLFGDPDSELARFAHLRTRSAAAITTAAAGTG
jgi:alkylation response protein AidB-like acyl-CoA dehydrogenase